jgi:hypothetical protein
VYQLDHMHSDPLSVLFAGLRVDQCFAATTVFPL